jgi:hypothetical protein
MKKQFIVPRRRPCHMRCCCFCCVYYILKIGSSFQNVPPIKENYFSFFSCIGVFVERISFNQGNYRSANDTNSGKFLHQWGTFELGSL